MQKRQLLTAFLHTPFLPFCAHLGASLAGRVYYPTCLAKLCHQRNLCQHQTQLLACGLPVGFVCRTLNRTPAVFVLALYIVLNVYCFTHFTYLFVTCHAPLQGINCNIPNNKIIRKHFLNNSSLHSTSSATQTAGVKKLKKLDEKWNSEEKEMVGWEMN